LFAECRGRIFQVGCSDHSEVVKNIILEADVSLYIFSFFYTDFSIN